VWLQGVLRAIRHTPAAVTFHHYPAGKIGGNDSLIFRPAFLRETVQNFTQIVARIRRVTNPTQPVWWGEGAFDFHSGHEGVTNAYEDALFSAVMYGSLPATGVQVGPNPAHALP
jgi:hypothetical protein